MKALVTGASGFIGSCLCEQLTRRGVWVTAMLRHPSEGPWDDSLISDLESPPDPSMLSGIDTVFHLAGKAHALSEIRQDEWEYFKINTDGTQRLLEVCQKAGVKTFVYFSSVKAAGDINGVMDELDLALPDTPYGRSKQAAEKLVLEGDYVPHPVVIRPTMVYGDTEKGNLPKMIRAIQAGRFPPLPETHNQRSMVHVDDVVQAAILAAERIAAAGQTYIVTDGNTYSTRQMYEWICDAVQKPVPAWKLPLFVLKLLASAGDALGAVRGRRFIFDSDALEKLTASAHYSSAKIEQQLGFKARRNLQEALQEIVQYLGAFR